MNRYQEKLLALLAFFVAFCEKNDLRYIVAGGTFLGAVRHQGFIPWDDDVDVAMPRPDYERLKILMSLETEKYLLELPQSPNADYLYPFAKIYDTSTTVVEEKSVPCKRGVWLDIFPVDGIANTYEDIPKNFWKQKILHKFLVSRTCAVRKERKWWKNLAIVICRLIPRKLIDEKKLLVKLDALCSEKSFDDHEYVGCYVGSYGKRDIFKKNIFLDTSEYIFQGVTVKGPRDYETYLTQFFGDWQKLPPFEKRKSGHDTTFVNLEVSYLEK